MIEQRHGGAPEPVRPQSSSSASDKPTDVISVQNREILATIGDYNGGSSQVLPINVDLNPNDTCTSSTITQDPDRPTPPTSSGSADPRPTDPDCEGGSSPDPEPEVSHEPVRQRTPKEPSAAERDAHACAGHT